MAEAGNTLLNTKQGGAQIAQPLHMRLPFISTSAFQDLRMLLVGAPVLWFLGLEQLVGLPILMWSVLKLGLNHRRIRFGAPAVLLLLVVATMFLALPAIDQASRYLTFIRTMSMYLMGVLVLIIVHTECRTTDQVKALLRSVVWMMGVGGFVALLGQFGILPSGFRSPAGYLLPSVIASTDYGSQIVRRSLGNQTWFQGLGSYFQVTGIFLFSTMSAAAAAISFPLAVYCVRTARHMYRPLYIVLAGLVLYSLIFSTGRTAWLSVALAAVITLVLTRRVLFKVIIVLAAIAAFAGSLIVMPNAMPDAVEGIVYARGAGSTNSRLTIYTVTLQGFIERPLFGWGTERDITTLENFAYPAGSHSHYLGFLFKYGLLGFSALAAFIALVARNVIQAPKLSATRGPERAAMLLMVHIRWALLTALCIGLTSVLDLDASLILIVWVVIAAGLVLGESIRQQSVVPAAGASQP